MIMLRTLKFLIVVAVFFAAVAVLTTQISANEGTVEMKSPDGVSRCFVASVLMPSQNYSLVVSCRNIVYPIDTGSFNYIIWSKPAVAPKGDVFNPNPNLYLKLGNIGVGKAQFGTSRAFSELMITREKGSDPAKPSSDVLMRGSIRPLSYLEGIEDDQICESQSPAPSLRSPEATPKPPSAAANTLKVVIGILAVPFLIVFVIGFIFFIYRSR